MNLKTIIIKNEELVKESFEIVMTEAGDTLEERLSDYNFYDDIKQEWVSESDYIELKKVLVNHIYLIHNNKDYLTHFIDIFSGVDLK